MRSDNVDVNGTFWCIDVVGGWAHVSRQLKHWVDGSPRLWSEKTREVAPNVHHAYQFGQLYYIKADDKKSAWRLYLDYRSNSRTVIRGNDDS